VVPTFDQLRVTLRVGPLVIHAAAGDFGIHRLKRPPDILGEGEVGFPVAGIEVVVENAADAARLTLIGVLATPLVFFPDAFPQ